MAVVILKVVSTMHLEATEARAPIPAGGQRSASPRLQDQILRTSASVFCSSELFATVSVLFFNVSSGLGVRHNNQK